MNNAYTEEEIERCTISGRQEIIFQLRELIRNGERVSITFDEGRQGFLTILIDVSEADGYLYFDIGGSAEINSAFLRAKRCTFTSVVGGIRIQFATRQAEEMQFNDEQVFAVRLPKTLLRLQRRELFRVQLPASKPFICRMRRGLQNELALQLRDISVGGIGILSVEKPDFEPLEILENCSIDLRDSGVLAVTLEVRHIHSKENRVGRQLWHTGYEFVDLSGVNEALIQRLMVRLEAERRALLPG